MESQWSSLDMDQADGSFLLSNNLFHEIVNGWVLYCLHAIITNGVGCAAG